MFINQNTKYADSFPMENRSSQSVLNAIQTFVKEHRVSTLVSDAERAFMSKDVVEFLISNRIELYTIVAENMKTGLSVINRFMRTLRDMIGKNRNIDEIEMRNLLKRYNKTVNSSTGFAPKDMTEDDEIRYIAQKILQQKAISQEEGYELGICELVRVVVPKKTLTKTRDQLSPAHYRIFGKEGLNYIIQADDGTTTRRTRTHQVPQFSGTKWQRQLRELSTESWMRFLIRMQRSESMMWFS